MFMKRAKREMSNFKIEMISIQERLKELKSNRVIYVFLIVLKYRINVRSI
jgi:hypothetical protein